MPGLKNELFGIHNKGGAAMKLTNQQKLIEQLNSHRVWIETLGEKGEKLGLDEIDFRHIDLSGYPLDQAYLTECAFDGMNLEHMDMSSSLLCSSSFTKSNLVNADFYKADLSYANFTDADAQGARFAKADLSESVFINTNLTNAMLISSSLYLTDLRNANMNHADISSASFRETLLQGATLTGLQGIEEAFIKSINIGTLEEPNILLGEEAIKWLQDKSLSKE
ncbi:pentapeptide repeat-containing protein [Paenibacillus sp. 2TAF8]|jgi:uncharacterized protein YjbI with pentapeptide repeats|uniref:pentapeptide repeat-containing protein n=1 Tax=Paenibacillus sp. 2TAF8 TaxID=3233020 RepID=UPI003F9CE940